MRGYVDNATMCTECNLPYGCHLGAYCPGTGGLKEFRAKVAQHPLVAEPYIEPNVIRCRSDRKEGPQKDNYEGREWYVLNGHYLEYGQRRVMNAIADF